MEAAGKFLAALQSEMRRGNIAPATEAHLRYEFRSIGWQNTAELRRAVSLEIERLEREVVCLKSLLEREP